MSKRKAEDDLQTGSSCGNDPMPTKNATPTTMTEGKTKKLLQLPYRLVDIVNSGSEIALRQFVVTNFTEDCLMKTPTMETAVYGRQHIAASVESVFMSTPDLVLSVDNVRLEQVNNVSSDRGLGHQCLVFDLTFQGTFSSPFFTTSIILFDRSSAAWSVLSPSFTTIITFLIDPLMLSWTLRHQYLSRRLLRLLLSRRHHGRDVEHIYYRCRHR